MSGENGTQPSTEQSTETTETKTPDALDEILDPKGQGTTEETSETKGSQSDETKEIDETSEDDDAQPITLESITLPEGFEQTDADKELLGSAIEIVNGAKTKQDLLQGLVNLQIEATQKASEKASEDAYDAWQETQTEWQDTIKADPVIGGSDEQVAANMGMIGLIIDKYSQEPNSDKDATEKTVNFAEDVRKAFDTTGAGNNPFVAKFLFNIAKVLNEPGAVPANPGNAGETSAAQRIFPSMSNK